MLPTNKRAAICVGIVLLLTLSVLLLLRLREPSTLARNAAAPGARMRHFPKIILWAWERPERLGFINPREVGVAYLAATIKLQGEKISTRPRLQPLDVPFGTNVIAVVRIESARAPHPTLSASQRAELVEALARVAHTPDITALQIDFDATQSERAFYRALLIDLRQRLPETMPLSITALASWCIFDNWLAGLPIDEAVPMLFRLGIDTHRINSHLQSGGELRAPICRESVGLSTDEAATLVPTGTERVYVFNPQSWTADALRVTLERIQK